MPTHEGHHASHDETATHRPLPGQGIERRAHLPSLAVPKPLYYMVNCHTTANYAALSIRASPMSTFTPGPMVDVRTIFLMN